MVERLCLVITFVSSRIITQACIQSNTVNDNTAVGFRLHALHSSTAVCSVRSYRLKIECRRYDLDIVERELASLSDNLSVEGDESCAVVVQSISVATLLIGVKVDASELKSRTLELVSTVFER
jgi:hypothetical protein